MASSIQLLRSTIAQERPFPGNLLEGQPAVNLNSSEPGLFFKAADGSLVKVGPAAITSDGSPPNSSPQGSSGNTVGELWLDKSINPAVLRVYDGSNWVDAGSGGGGSPGIVTLQRWVKTAVGGETSLSGPDNTAQILSYTPGLEEVFLNGVLLTPDADYFTPSGTSITSLSPLTAGDEVTVLGWTPFNILGEIDGADLIDGTVSDAKIADDAGIVASKLSFVQAGSGAIARTVDSRLREVISVKDFGAKGDGVTDDRAAIQVAIDAVQSAGGGELYFPKGDYRILSSHPTKTYTTSGDDGSVPAGFGANLSPEDVYQMPVGLWLKQNVILKLAPGTLIRGDWVYQTGSPIDLNQRIGILISSAASVDNPKVGLVGSSIISLNDNSGGITNFMMNIVSEGILTGGSFTCASASSAFPFVAQGADRVEFNVRIYTSKTGLIIGGQWLTRSNSTLGGEFIPRFPAGFGTPGTYPGGDVQLRGWCDNCIFSSSMIRPDGSGAPLEPTAEYGAWEQAIDTFFDTYFFKSASTARIGLPAGVPATTTPYPGVVGFGIMIFSRYGRSVGNPRFENIKTYNLIRGDIYCDNAISLNINNVYSERGGTLADGSAFGVSTQDPYGTPGVASGCFIRASGSNHSISNYFAFSSASGKALTNTSSTNTNSCFFNSTVSPFNNYVSQRQGFWPSSTLSVAGSLGGYGYNRSSNAGVKGAPAGSPTDIATISAPNSGPGYGLHGEVIIQATAGSESAGISGYASSVYRFPIILSNNNFVLKSLGGTAATSSTIGSINPSLVNITLGFSCSVSGSIATVTITPNITGTLGVEGATLYWRIEMEGAVNTSISAL